MKEKTFKKYKNKPSKSLRGGEFETAVVSSDNTDFSHIQPVVAKPLEVVVYNNGFDKALRAFRALVQKERTLSLYKEKQSYEKPSDKKRRKRNEMKRKLLEINSSNKFFKRKRKTAEVENG
jgi:ribosomal protein S21